MIKILLIFLLFVSNIFFSSNLFSEEIELSKNHLKAIAQDCKYNLKKDFDSPSQCKRILYAAMKSEGVLFNLNNFSKQKVRKAEISCSVKIKDGVYAYNKCVARLLDVNIEREDPPIVIVSPSEEDNNNDDEVYIVEKETNRDVILTANEIYEKVTPSAYQVNVGNLSSGRYEKCGSAIVIKKDLLATNCHVVYKTINDEITSTPMEIINIFNVNDNPRDPSSFINARIFKSDIKNDVCIIQSQKPVGPPVNIKNFDQIKILEDSFAIGSPQCQPGVMTRGVIQNKYEFGYFYFDVPILQTNAHIRGGNSGGGLFDNSGKLIGINTLGEIDLSVSNPFNWALSADNFIKLIEK